MYQTIFMKTIYCSMVFKYTNVGSCTGSSLFTVQCFARVLLLKLTTLLIKSVDAHKHQTLLFHKVNKNLLARELLTKNSQKLL